MMIEQIADAIPSMPNGAGHIFICPCCSAEAHFRQNGMGFSFDCTGGCEQEKIVDALGSENEDFARLLLDGLEIADDRRGAPGVSERVSGLHDDDFGDAGGHSTAAIRDLDEVEKQTAPDQDQEPLTRGLGGFLDQPQNNGNHQKRLDRNPQTPLPEKAVERVFRRVPPQDIRAEQSLLGSVLLEPASIDRISGRITASDFYRESHREVYKAMLRLAATGKLAESPEAPIDLTSLIHELNEKGVYEAVGMQTLMEIDNATPTSLHVEHWADIVAKQARRRDLIRGSANLIERAYEGADDAELEEQWKHLTPATTTQPALPLLITPDITIMSGSAFAARQRAIQRHWLVEGFLARKEISLWSGKVEHGKTTLIRTLVMCFLRGEMFLERHVYPGRVLYVMLDADGEGLTYEQFGKLGIDWENDEIDLLIDPIMCLRPNSFQQFHARLLQLRPSLVVIDPIGRFQKIEEKEGGFNGYGMTYAMAQFSELAKQTDCHMVMLHHIPRGRSDIDDPATAGFGSIAIAGGCNARFSCIKKPGDIYSIITSKGKGGGFVPFDGEMRLTKDPETEWVTLAGPLRWQDQADAAKPKVLEVINGTDEELTAEQIRQQIPGCTRSSAGSAAKSLFKEGLINIRITKANKHFFSRKENQQKFGILNNEAE